MNSSDAADLALTVLPRRAVRAGAVVLCVAIALHVPHATRLVFWYANDKTHGIVESVMKVTHENHPDTLPAR